MTRDLDVYLRLERLLLDARGNIDPAMLVPVRLPAPRPAELSAPTVSGKAFDKAGAIGWLAPAGWRREAA